MCVEGKSQEISEEEERSAMIMCPLTIRERNSVRQVFD
jgi:hypothetical protein